MASRGGTSSGSSLALNASSEEDLLRLMDQKRRKRMASNRESARRSRMRRQRHLDELTARLSQLRRENETISRSLGFAVWRCANVEAENAIMRAQAEELSHRLEHLNQIAGVLEPVGGGEAGYGVTGWGSEFVNESLCYLPANQPVLACADAVQYWC